MEWKFARTKLWMTYIDETTIMPAPLNMIPTASSLCQAAKFIDNIVRRRHDNASKPETLLAYDLSVS